MIGTVYDYLVATIIMGVIFVAAVVVVPNVGYGNLLYIDEQQLRNVALEALKAMTLDVGSPVNWGSSNPFDQNNLQRFGLAHISASSFYVLDSDKVQRLVVDDPIGYIEYEKMRELLGLEGYGFRISIIPPFNATWTKNSDDPSFINFTGSVSEISGTPIPNANVDATIIYSGKNGNDVTLYIDEDEGTTTDALGKCEITKQLELPPGEELQDVIVVFRVSVANVATVVSTYQNSQSPNFSNVARINIVGDDVSLTIPPESQPNDARWIDFLVMIDEDGNILFLHNGTRSNDDKLTWGQGYETWVREITDFQYSNPFLLIGGIWAVQGENGGRAELLVVGPYPSWLGARVLQYGDASGPKGAGSAVKLQRPVIVAGMTYIFELILWKE